MIACCAYQVSDQMVCPRCDLSWDVNDSDPPPCRDEPAPCKHLQTRPTEQGPKCMNCGGILA